MDPSQVFVFAEETPVSQDLAWLLHEPNKLGALGWETDLNEAIRRIHKIRPPAVVVASQDADMDSHLAVSRIQNECPEVQIAEVDLESRVVRVYGKDQIFKELKELLAIVERLEGRSRNKSQESQPGYHDMMEEDQE